MSAQFLSICVVMVGLVSGTGVAPPTGSYCGSVPLILEMRVTFHGSTLDFYNNVKVAKQVIDCKAEPETFDASTGKVSIVNITSDDDCMGKALRSQKKDPSQLALTMNADSSLTMKAPGWPSLKLKACQEDDLVGAEGPVALKVEVPAAACTADDTNLWNGDAGHSKWQANMTSCGTKCLGRQTCVTTCMAGDGWSSGCAGCFGSLAQCTATHCLLKCRHGRNPDCVSCLKKAGCDTAAFGTGSCTGFSEPNLQDSIVVI